MHKTPSEPILFSDDDKSSPFRIEIPFLDRSPLFPFYLPFHPFQQQLKGFPKKLIQQQPNVKTFSSLEQSFADFLKVKH
jgi:hypothetical protein